MKTIFAICITFNCLILFSQNLPGFQAKNTAGKAVDRDSILRSNKVTVINFWATWCSPCKQEMREINRLTTLPEFSGVQFISVSIDEQKDIEAAKAWFKTNKFSWKLYLDPGKDLFSKVLAVTENTSTAIPISIVIDHNGLIVGYHTGFDIEKYKSELLLDLEYINKNKSNEE